MRHRARVVPAPGRLRLTKRTALSQVCWWWATHGVATCVQSQIMGARMSRTAKLLLVASLAAFSSSVRSEVQATLHRSQAGSLDDSGWTQASSTSGAFTVRLPCLYNDLQMYGSKDDPSATIHTVGCRLPDGRKFSATRLRYGKRPASDVDPLAMFSSSLDSIGAKVSRLELNGHRAVDAEVSDPGRYGYMRMIQLKEGSLLLIVEAPATACDDLDKDAHLFIQSVEWEDF